MPTLWALNNGVPPSTGINLVAEGRGQRSDPRALRHLRFDRPVRLLLRWRPLPIELLNDRRAAGQHRAGQRARRPARQADADRARPLDALVPVNTLPSPISAPTAWRRDVAASSATSRSPTASISNPSCLSLDSTAASFRCIKRWWALDLMWNHHRTGTAAAAVAISVRTHSAWRLAGCGAGNHAGQPAADCQHSGSSRPHRGQAWRGKHPGPIGPQPTI